MSQHRDLESGKIHQPHSQHQDRPRVKCACFDISNMPANQQFIFLSLGLMLFFMTNSYVEEYLFNSLEDFNFGWYMTFFELLCFAAFAAIERKFMISTSSLPGVDSVFSHKAALAQHAFVALAMTASRGLTNSSLQYLNYPTQVIFKSLKVLTVMIGAVIYFRKRYQPLEYVSVVFLVLSAILFSLGDSDVSSGGPENSMIGYVIVLLSLAADSAHANTQEGLMKQHGASESETVLFTNFFAAIFTFFVVVAKGELLPAMAYCANAPSAYFLFVLRALVVYGGVVCYIAFVQRFSSLSATIMTTIRKILTVLCSFLFFPKPFGAKYAFGLLFFAASLALGVYVAHQNNLNKAKSAAAVPKPRERAEETELEPLKGEQQA